METRYLDVIWLDNLMMNVLLLLTVRRLSGNRTAQWRLWLSAAVGALYAVFLLLPGYGLLAAPACKLLLSLGMLFIGFRIRDFVGGLKLLGLLYLTTFLFGGAALGLYFFFSESIGYSQGIFYIRNYPVKLLLFSTAAVLILYRSLWPWIRERRTARILQYPVVAELDGRAVSLQALLDTGHDLVCPLSGQPVLVVSYEAVKALLPPGLDRMFGKTGEVDLDQAACAAKDPFWAQRFRILPFQSIGRKDGLMIGCKADVIKIQQQDAWVVRRDVILGICPDPLSGDHAYQALLSPRMIHGWKENIDAEA